MRALFTISIYVVAVPLVGGLLAPWMWWGLQGVMAAGWLTMFADVPFSRVANRAFMLACAVGLYPLLRLLRIRGWTDWGYAVRGREGRDALLHGLVLGLCTLTILLIAEFYADLLYMDLRRSNVDVLYYLGKGLLSGLAVAFLEETFFRGILFSALRRELSARLTILITALLYMGVHFVKASVPAEEVTWVSGWLMVGTIWQRFLNPELFGAMATLLAVGLLLGMIREQTGHIWYTVGLHWGWVAIITMGRKISVLNQDSNLLWLISDYDDVTGYLAAIYLVVLIALWMWLVRRQPHRLLVAEAEATS